MRFTIQRLSYPSHAKINRSIVVYTPSVTVLFNDGFLCLKIREPRMRNVAGGLRRNSSVETPWPRPMDLFPALKAFSRLMYLTEYGVLLIGMDNNDATILT